MKNIVQIFLRDVRKLSHNTAALVIVIGLLVVPTLYAWFNIGGSWDPYENTSEISVAVASDDRGYEGELLALKLNLGDELLSALHENEDLNWVFTDSGEAVSGVKAGKYYAALVVPESFSEDMMSLFSTGGELKNPQLFYYSNDKENAIAPRITDAGSDTVQAQVSETFVKTVSQSALSALQTLVNLADETDQSELAENLAGNLEDISDDLLSAAGTLEAFESMASATETMLASTSGFLKDTQERSDKDLNSLTSLQGAAEEAQSAMDGTTEALNEALKSSAALYEQMSAAVKTAVQAAASSEDAAQLKASLARIAQQLDTVIAGYGSAADTLEAANGQLALVNQMLPADQRVDLTSVVADLRTTVTLMETLKSALLEAQTSVESMISDASSAQTELDALLAKLQKSAAFVQKDYEDNVKGDLEKLSGSVGDTDAKVSALLDSLDTGLTGVYGLSDSTQSDLGKLRKALSDSADLLTRAAEKLGELAGRLRTESGNDRYDTLEALLDEDVDLTGSFLSAPVTLETTGVYEVENYGSAMAPFYTTLSIWVGGVVLAAILKTDVKEKELLGLADVKNYQKYLGRYLIFLVLGILQALLICLGDLYFLGIQCESPLLFLLAGVLSSLVYVNIIYTLTASFGDIGKAVSVILMVMQVAGTGGNFPIELAPDFFQRLYEAMPFVHSMNAMRECVAGFYGNTYGIEMGRLALYLVPSLLLGLLFRRPVIRWNERFQEKLEGTRMM